MIINQTPQQIEELHGSFINVLNTIIELNECQNDETISHGNSKENSIESIESQIQKNESLQLNEINYTNDAVEKIDENKTEQQTAQKDSYDPVAKLVEPEENYEITNLINSITVSTQGKSERGITIIGETKNDEASTSDKNLILKLHQQISVDSNRDENEEIIKSEVNIQYKQPNKLQQININDSKDSTKCCYSGQCSIFQTFSFLFNIYHMTKKKWVAKLVYRLTKQLILQLKILQF